MKPFGRLFFSAFFVTAWLLWLLFSFLYLTYLGEMRTGIDSVFATLVDVLEQGYHLLNGLLSDLHQIISA